MVEGRAARARELVAAQCNACGREYPIEYDLCPDCGDELERIWRDAASPQVEAQDL
jgi:rRNA maturation endonuclease Nob1